MEYKDILEAVVRATVKYNLTELQQHNAYDIIIQLKART